MSELAPYDPTRLMDAVRDRIRAEFVGMIPEAAWADMVKQAVDSFMAPERAGGYMGAASRPSPFTKLVQDELSNEIKRRLQQFFAEPEWQRQWDGMKPVAGEAIRRIISENADAILANMIGMASQNVINDIRARL